MKTEFFFYFKHCLSRYINQNNLLVHLNSLLINTFQTMFLIKKSAFKEFPIILGIIIYASCINWLSGSVGIIPIDSFGFLDTGFSILKNKLPIRDFWIFTGLLVDYMEAFFINFW